MLDNTTMIKLQDMNLNAMASSFSQQLDNSAMSELTFEERFGLLVDAEWHNRNNSRLTKLIRGANYVFPNACLEDIDYRPDRQLDKSLITRLGVCGYISDFRNIIVLGATGSGKTYLSNAFGVAANRNGITVKYKRLPDLFSEMAIARSSGTYGRAIKFYSKPQLLILDEWLLYPLSERESRDLLEIAEARHNRGSMIFCSQFEVKGWHVKIGEPTIADAICDRIVHNSHVININGAESMRKHRGISEEK